ncbi:MAG: hypothetical protein R6T96_11405, partial [Longimicrobiales bacterium]
MAVPRKPGAEALAPRPWRRSPGAEALPGEMSRWMDRRRRGPAGRRDLPASAWDRWKKGPSGIGVGPLEEGIFYRQRINR